MSMWSASKHKVYTDKTQQLLKNGHVLNNAVIVSEVKKWKKQGCYGGGLINYIPNEANLQNWRFYDNPKIDRKPFT